MNILYTILMVINISAIVFVLLIGYDGLIKLGKSLYRLITDTETIKYLHRKHRLSAESTIPATLILPDCGKDPNNVSIIKELMALDYSEYEVVAIIDSRSKDSPLSALTKEFSLVSVDQPVKISVPSSAVRNTFRSPVYGNLIVVDMEDAARHNAINAGINYSHYPLVIILGLGYSIDLDSLSEIASLFSANHNVVASGGLPRIHKNKQPIGFLGSLQETEYLRTFPAGLALPGHNRLSVVLSSYGAFRKQNVIALGGFPPGGSETEMVVRLSRDIISEKSSRNVNLPPNPILDTEPLQSLGSLIRQRIQWQSSMAFTLWNNKSMLFNPKYGRTGMLDIPYLWLFNIVIPIIEALGCITIPVSFAIGLIGLDLLLVFLAVECIFGTLVSISAIASQQILENERPSFKRLMRQTFSAVINNLGYRQFLLFFNVAGLFIPRKKG